MDELQKQSNQGPSQNLRPPVFKHDKLTVKDRQLADALKVACERDFFTFCVHVLKQDKLIPKVHGPLCEFVSRAFLRQRGKTPRHWDTDWVGTGDMFPRKTMDADMEYDPKTATMIVKRHRDRNLLIVEPRGSFKTTIIMCYAMWVLAHDPNARVAVIAYNEKKAANILNAITEQAEKNPWFRYLYGRWNENSSLWQVLSKNISTRTKYGNMTPSLLAWGAGTSKTGHHPSHILMDDPIDYVTLESVEKTEEVTQMLDSIWPLLVDDSQLIVTGTFWGQMDLYQRIMTPPLESRFGYYIRSSYNPDGSLWLPDVLSEEVLADKRATMTKRLFSSQYISVPLPDSEASINLDDVVKHNELDEDDRPKRSQMLIGVSIDPADTEGGPNAGSWAISTLGFTSNVTVNGVFYEGRHVWQLENEKARVTAAKATSAAIRMVGRWNADVVGCEKTGFSKSYITATLEPALLAAGIFKKVLPWEHGGRAKVGRIEKILKVMIEQHRFHIYLTHEALIEEMRQFPSDAMFDIMDADSYLTEYANSHNFYPDMKQTKSTAMDSDQEERDRIDKHLARAYKVDQMRNRIAAAQVMNNYRRLQSRRQPLFR